jgi:hypothetical protein
MHGTAPENGRDVHQGKFVILEDIQDNPVIQGMTPGLRGIEPQRLVDQGIRMRGRTRLSNCDGNSEKQTA